MQQNLFMRVSKMWSWASKMTMKPATRHNDKLLKFSELSLLCSKLLQLCKHRLIVNNIGNMMMMAKQVYKVVVMLTPPMLVIVLLAKLVAVVMEVVVVAVQLYIDPPGGHLGDLAGIDDAEDPAFYDGPEIDAHIIDWDKFLPRFSQFKAQEDKNRLRHGL